MSFEWIFTLLTYAVPFMVILTIIVFAHEFGHYLLAKWNGVKVEVFSIGFGPEIFGFNDKSGTRWKFSYIPLGGYVRMFSDVDASSRPDTEALKKLTEDEKKYSHHYKTVGQRIQISIAGPAANYIFGILLLAIIYSISGQRVQTEEPIIGFIEQGGAAAEAGIKVGDKILSIDSQEIKTYDQFTKLIRSHPDKAMNVELNRQGEKVTTVLTPKVITGVNENGLKTEIGFIGVAADVISVQRDPFSALGYACLDALNVTGSTLYAIGQMLIGHRSAEGLSGPIGIAMHTGEIATTDLATFFWFMAFLSLNLGLVNLLPIPVLDGGHLLFYFIEAIRGKPLSEKAQEIGFKIGLAIILALLIFTTFKDLSKLALFSKLGEIFG